MSGFIREKSIQLQKLKYMRRLLLLCFMCIPFFLNAQITSEDFESYNVGSFDSQWDPAEWVGWFGGPSNVVISDDYANSGSKSMQIEQDDDIVAYTGALNSGTYEITFMQYIPSGNGAYVNFQHNYSNTEGDWAFEVYFSDEVTGQAIIITDAVQTPFPIVHDSWAETRVVANFNAMTGEYYYNGTLVHTWALNTNASGGPGLNRLNAINFFGACLDAGCTSLAYYDDINVNFIPPPDYDLVLAEYAPPTEYTRVPVGLEKPLNLTANVSNLGVNDASNVSVTFTVSNASGVVFTDTSPVVGNIASGAVQAFTSTNSFTPTTGAYTVEYSVTLDESDDNTANNTVSVPIIYSVDDDLDYEYARDDGNYVDGLGTNNQGNILGHNYDFAVSVGVASINTSSIGGAAGETIVGHILSVNADGSPNAVIASTDPVTIDTPGASGSPVDYTLSFPVTVDLDAGEYVFGVEQVGNTNLLVSTTDNIFTPGKTWASLDNGMNWDKLEDLGFALALHIRPALNRVDVINIEEPVGFVDALSIFPNPTSGLFAFDITLVETKNLTVEVYNAQGQLITTERIGNTQGGEFTMDLSAVSPGMYFAKFLIDEQVLTQPIVIQK